MIKPRKPFLALLISLVPGLGQIYNGQVKKGLMFLLIDLIVPFLFGWSGILKNFNGFIALLVFTVLFMIYRMADGFVSGRKLKNYEVKRYNQWYIYLGYFIAFSTIRTYIDLPFSTGIQTFIITSVSMNPTMQPGDRVVTSVDYYDNHTIGRGDIVVFNPPNGEFWIFRVIGMPNDSLEVKDGVVYINNYSHETTKTKEYDLEGFGVIQYNEEISPDKTITTLRGNRFTAKDFERIIIPENEYFLMGDNRDNAHDSRYLGTIKREDIVGRVLYTYWGNASNRINIDFRDN